MKINIHTYIYIDEGSTIVGKYANSQLNENGQLLIGFCSDHHFSITNSTVELGNPHSGSFGRIRPSAQRGLPFARERI